MAIGLNSASHGLVFHSVWLEACQWLPLFGGGSGSQPAPGFVLPFGCRFAFLGMTSAWLGHYIDSVGKNVPSGSKTSIV